MKLFAFLCCVGLAHSALVRRDAKAEAGGYGAVVGGAVPAPVCNSIPVKTCVPRQIQTPRKVCRQESDEIVDITITEHCEEVITTTCQQTSRSSAVLGRESKIVAIGVDATPDVTVTHGISAHGAHIPIVHGTVGHSGYRKREADAEADADASYDLGYAAAPPVEFSPSVCNSVPVKQCKNKTVSVPRKVAKTVCAVHVDITTVQECKEVITTHCSEITQHVAHSSNVLGQETKVGPETVVATHGNAAIAAPVVALYGHNVAGHAVVGHAVAGNAVAGQTVAETGV